MECRPKAKAAVVDVSRLVSRLRVVGHSPERVAHEQIADAMGFEFRRQRALRKLGFELGVGRRPDVDEILDARRLERVDELGHRAGTVADGQNMPTLLHAPTLSVGSDGEGRRSWRITAMRRWCYRCARADRV